MTARARWARISETYSRSPGSPAEVLDRHTSNWRAWATPIRPAAMVEKYGSAMSCTTTPTVVLSPVATALAWRLAVYPSSATAWWTRLSICWPTLRGPSLTTRDAVVSETPARSATSWRVTRVGCGPRSALAPRRAPARAAAWPPAPAAPWPPLLPAAWSPLLPAAPAALVDRKSGG